MPPVSGPLVWIIRNNIRVSQGTYLLTHLDFMKSLLGRRSNLDCLCVQFSFSRSCFGRGRARNSRIARYPLKSASVCRYFGRRQTCLFCFVPPPAAVRDMKMLICLSHAQSELLSDVMSTVSGRMNEFVCFRAQSLSFRSRIGRGRT